MELTWRELVNKVRKENPGLMLKDHLKMAAKIYNPKKAMKTVEKAVKGVAKKTRKMMKGGKKHKKSKSYKKKKSRTYKKKGKKSHK